MKRKRPVFNSLKALDDLQDADLSIKQAKGIVRVIEDSQENLTAADELKESERDVKAHTDAKHSEATAHTDAKHAEAMSGITDINNFLGKCRFTLKVLGTLTAIAGSVTAIVYYLLHITGG